MMASSRRSFQRASQHLLGVAAAITLGGIKEIDADIEGGKITASMRVALRLAVPNIRRRRCPRKPTAIGETISELFPSCRSCMKRFLS